MHDEDFADVVGKKPVVLLFATPALCQSRVCGPVVDIAEQVKAERGDDDASSSTGDLRDNEVGKGLPPAARRVEPADGALGLHDRRDGHVAARLEGAYSAKELREAIDAARG